MEQITNLLAYGRQATNNIRRRRIKLKIFIHPIRYFLFSRAIMDSLLDPLRKDFPSVKLQNSKPSFNNTLGALREKMKYIKE